MTALLFPRRCQVCEKVISPGEGLICKECEAALPWISQPACLKCGAPLSDEIAELCPDCRERSHYFRSGICIFRYENGIRGSVIRMKFHNRREYIPFYAAAMAEGGETFFNRVKPSVLLPVPRNRKKRKERGFDQCLLLTRRLSELTQIPMEEDNLVRTRYTKAQKGLSHEERTANVRGAFRLRYPERIQGPVILVDDIATTLSTIDAVCLELMRHGISDVYFMALCTGRNG